MRRGFSVGQRHAVGIISLLIFLLAAPPPVSGDEILIGTGTLAWSYPLAGHYATARTQSIYLADEIGSACRITGLGVDVTAASAQTFNNLTVRLKHTDLAIYGRTSQWESSGWTIVFQSDHTITTAGWALFDFSTPFDFDGMHNLLVDISFSNVASGSAGYCRSSTSGGSRSLSCGTDADHGDPLDWSAKTPSPTIGSIMPNLKLLANPILTPTFSPDGGLYGSDQQVVVDCATQGVVIRYTTNGEDPTQTSPGIAPGESLDIRIVPPTHLKARAFKTGLPPSAVKGALYRGPAVVFVSTGGSDNNTGASWAAAKRTVQAGVNTATVAEAVGDSVWVAAGTYVERIAMRAGVSLYGGFAEGDTDLAQRDPSVHPTILDGDQAGSVITIPSAANAGTRVDGFTIRNGSGTPSSGYRRGGGIWCGASSSAVIANNTITGNQADRGGGIYCPSSSSLDIRDNQIVGNQATYGGGILCFSSSPHVFRNTITDNLAEYYGGGIHCEYYSAPVITENTISGNEADGGGGIFCDTSNASIRANTIRRNRGGGVRCWFLSPEIHNNLIAENTVGSGVYCQSATPVISNNRITGNVTDHSSGAGVACVGSAASIINNAITGNRANQYAGGGIACSDCSPLIANNTITANHATSGGGLSCSNGSPKVQNTVIAFNSSGVLARDDGEPQLRHNCVYGNTQFDFSGVADATGTDGNIAADPALLAAAYNEVHLKPESPCIDAGLDSVSHPEWRDMDGQPRVQGQHVDIGADESDGLAAPYVRTVVRVSLQGDDTHDGSTWPLAKRNVQAAIDAASAAGAGEVWVGAGMYVERITLKQWVHVYGGFAGTEAVRSDRDWTANPTVLDGSAAGSVVVATAPGHWAATIDGLTLRNGRANYGGGIDCHFSSPIVRNSTFTQNRGALGGAINCSYSCPLIANNTISGNDATGSGKGGGMYCWSAQPIVVNCTIVGNNATEQGGGLYCFGGAPIITNNTVVGNTGRYSGGFYLEFSPAVLCNNVVAFNTYGIRASGETPSLRNNCLYNPGGLDYNGPTPGLGDIQLDPLFVNKEAGDYRVRDASPCIDAGYNAGVPSRTLVDRDGHARFLDDPATVDCRWTPGICGSAAIVDIGAFEFVPLIAGDFNRDGVVNGHDVDIFRACATGPGVLCASTALPEGCGLAPDEHGRIPVDLDANGAIDMADFALLQRRLDAVPAPDCDLAD